MVLTHTDTHTDTHTNTHRHTHTDTHTHHTHTRQCRSILRITITATYLCFDMLHVTCGWLPSGSCGRGPNSESFGSKAWRPNSANVGSHAWRKDTTPTCPCRSVVPCNRMQQSNRERERAIYIYNTGQRLRKSKSDKMFFGNIYWIPSTTAIVST